MDLAMRTGFTLGKYAPLHKGHEYVIETALREMDHVIVVIYCASEVTAIPTLIRANWIKQIFPTVEVIIAEDGPQDTGYSQAIITTQNHYLLNLLKGRTIDSFYSSEQYGDSVSQAFSCQHRMVDAVRKKYPISATLLRNKTTAIKPWVSKCVFNTLKPKYYFIGGPSTGKSTIAQYGAKRLGGSYCQEFGRDYWLKFQKNHRLTLQDLEIIAHEQTQLEDSISQEDKDAVFIDTTTLTTLAYAYYYFEKSSDLLSNRVEPNLYKYQHVFLCNTDIPFEDSWDRSGPHSREKIQEINQRLLSNYHLNYTLLSGSLDQRFDTLKKYTEDLEHVGMVKR
jgi:NadR type nicotinamide-nucleotide adenylyltransferase